MPPRKNPGYPWESWEEDYLRRSWPRSGLDEVTRDLNAQRRGRGLGVRTKYAVRYHANAELRLFKTEEYRREGTLRSGKRFIAVCCPTCGGTRSVAKVLAGPPAGDGVILREFAVGGPSGGGWVPTGRAWTWAEAERLGGDVARVLRVLKERLRATG